MSVSDVRRPLVMGSSHSPDLAQGSHTTLTSLNGPRRDALAFLRVSYEIHWVL